MFKQSHGREVTSIWKGACGHTHVVNKCCRMHTQLEGLRVSRTLLEDLADAVAHRAEAMEDRRAEPPTSNAGKFRVDVQRVVVGREAAQTRQT